MSRARSRRPVVIVMAKTPRPGHVKSRLAREIGVIEAARWQRLQTARLLRRLAADPRFETWAAVAPDRDAVRGGLWRDAARVLPQGGGDLGRRMVRALAAAWPRPAVLIGSDIPEAGPAQVIAALRALGGAEVVLGPATDGGYWLIGLRGRALRTAPTRLAAVRWSTPWALEDTARALADFRIRAAARLSDVDRAEDLR